MIYHGYKELQDELKRQGLPWTRTFLQPLENLGLISKPENVLRFHHKDVGLSRRDLRLYTEEDIQKIVDTVRDYEEKHNPYYTSNRR